MMKKQITLPLIIFLLMGLLLAGCGGLTLPVKLAPFAPAPEAPAAVAPAATTAQAAGDALAAWQEALENIYDRVNPAVVNIRVVQKEEVSTPGIPEIPGFPFFFRPPETPQEPQEFFRRGAGSGFVWDKQGHIVTNNHVVADADKISVTFADGTTVSGEVIGTDPDSDLAVVKVDVPASRLQPVQLADSTQVKVGQLAIAIGNPFGLEGTMTTGIVSALGRLLPVDSGDTPGPGYSIPDVIQTDAPINPGNSGGVLVNDRGQVIGVTSAIISPVRASAGIGFAIPSAIVQQVVPTLIESGYYEHPWLGISGTSLTPDLAEAAGLASDLRGGLIVDVVPDSPADKAGLRGSDRRVTIDGQEIRVGGDVIVAIDDQPLQGFDDLITYLVRETRVGQTVNLTVLRRGEEEVIEVTLAARPKTDSEGRQAEGEVAHGAWLGIRGGTITPALAQAMNLDADQRGVLIEQVEAGSPADEAGLRGSYKPVTLNGRRLLVGGDIIVAVDGQAIENMEGLQALIRQAKPGQAITLTVLRDGESIDVEVTLGERP
ncbi:MAG: trypsin-like peptidase domain-containing protein [Anaerolineae bacterium]